MTSATLTLVPTADPRDLPTTRVRPTALSPSRSREHPRTARPSDLEPTHLMHRFATVVLEVLQGRRATHQLSRWLGDEAAASLDAWAQQPVWRGATLGSTRACRLSERVIEGCVRLDLAERSVMVTLRLEHGRRQWACTQFASLPLRGMGAAA